jgi:IS30 family transposase
MTPEVCALIEEKIHLYFSPEQVFGWLNIAISHERIYQHIWTDKRQVGELYKHLRHLCPSEIEYSNKKRKKQYGLNTLKGR